jgi:inosine/xanthosine triphosphate pyrophosphatase family protein
MHSMNLYFFTENNNKFKEVSYFLEKNNVILIQSPLNIPEYQGTTNEIAINKALYVKS